MPYNHAIYCQQIGLIKLGFNPGVADGLDGSKTRRALSKSEAARFGGKVPVGASKGMPPRPLPNYHARVKVFGVPGREAALKQVKLPWKMQIVGMPGKYRSTIRMHKLIADRMIMALTEIREVIGMVNVKKYGLDLFGGDYVNRPVRGGTAKSDHAWGLALDLNPSANGNHHTWKAGAKSGNGTYEMPAVVIRIFKKHGFQVGFKRSNGSRRDMMHIAYINRP